MIQEPRVGCWAHGVVGCDAPGGSNSADAEKWLARPAPLDGQNPAYRPAWQFFGAINMGSLKNLSNVENPQARHPGNGIFQRHRMTLYMVIITFFMDSNKVKRLLILTLLMIPLVAIILADQYCLCLWGDLSYRLGVLPNHVAKRLYDDIVHNNHNNPQEYFFTLILLAVGFFLCAACIINGVISYRKCSLVRCIITTIIGSLLIGSWNIFTSIITLKYPIPY